MAVHLSKMAATMIGTTPSYNVIHTCHFRKVAMAASCGFYSVLLFYGFVQYFYKKHVSFNITCDGYWTRDRFDVFLTKINSAERSVFYVECLSKLTQRTVMAKWRSFETSKASTRNN